MKTKGIYFLYRALQAFALPALLLYFVYRGLRSRAWWGGIPQRFGFVPHSFTQTRPGAIWLHAVSVGEVLACLEFARRLRAEYPHSPLFVSTSTLAGRAAAEDKLKGVAEGVFFAPVDYVFAIRRVVRALYPSILIVAETEIWPNLFREVKRTGAALAIVNGRISDRAWPRYRALRRFFSAVMPVADVILAQSGEMRDRFVELGALPERVRDAGNFKYDFEASAAEPDSRAVMLLRQMKHGRVWIAASTVTAVEAGDPDEHDVVIDAFRQLAEQYPDLSLVLAPRKPEHFDLAAQKLTNAGLGYVRRSTGQGEGRILLLDSIGELGGLFAYGDVVFMGGTLARRGGHNILEPALFGKPVVIGPHMENFRAIAAEFRALEACVEIAGPAELAAAMARLLDDPDLARSIGRRALECAQSRRGATLRAIEAVRRLRDSVIPRYRSAFPWFPIRWMFSRLWLWGGNRRSRRALARRRTLPLPVISAGNLTMGGTGKTPCVLRLAAMLRDRGHRPGILTRGYGRSSHQEHLIVSPGASLSAAHSGDEPQIFIRSGIAPVGIGGDRYGAGLLLAREFDVDVLLLDDGFQHRRLDRDLDLVLIDALDPFGGGELFPLGRMREPISALARAGAIVVTRSDLSDNAGAIESEVRRWNRHTPIFHAHIEPRAWIDRKTGAAHPVSAPPFHAAGAFCGLGNPESFRRTLNRLGIAPVEWVTFDDHHRYRLQELQWIAQHAAVRGAKALVTTEKDLVNLPEDCEDLLARLPLYWLKIEMAIEPEEELMQLLEGLFPHPPG